ncbi:MAG TPA: hypothetical protein VF589_12635 [Allosphingosinicella sp.]|jgi:hypothetical protein
MLHLERLVDLDARPQLDYDLVEVPFPAEGEAIPAHCHMDDWPIGDSLYGSEADAEREAAWLIRSL